MNAEVKLGTAVEGKHFTKDGKLASFANKTPVSYQRERTNSVA
jgi:hypothetical protein